MTKFKTMQMVDVQIPTTDGRELILSRYTQPEGASIGSMPWARPYLDCCCWCAPESLAVIWRHRSVRLGSGVTVG